MHVACPHCGKVHDVTNLSPGSTLRCACGGYFQVPPKPQEAPEAYPPPPPVGPDEIPTAGPAQRAPLPQTGHQAPASAMPAAKPTPGTVIASLILGCLSFLTCGILMSIPGLILGYSGRNQIDENPDKFEGLGAAKAAIVINWINIILTVVIIVAGVAIALIAGLQA